ncbi:Zinc dependent phospholipase C [Alkalithermobacter thermoalcaliphilus JW-YL-7 = DSM 7308]|uniref:Phospholipase C/P1 nuclease n=1 Tax=Alkalithermobacter thermoalcaliphilus JW-YL-7 = DSM 7308 TaxID=1121328 RepID=A0A150FNZ3_CLOPD|nr:phospholipase C/P1 nuclease [[Clostridium] paradoxum JW-YL-7 = DSM 7308]SHK54999.1 Zinc dependent phospholipase C [[Clostridium] paradoxum JW-YL-7 = DSM 7308]
MLVQTHKIISHHIYTNIKNELNIDLNKKFLMYGSMKPDIALSLALRKHYKNENLDFVIDQILSLTEEGLNENFISINKFSTKLGIITHFLSDFFCLPHSNREYYHDKLIQHLNYENKLHSKFKNLNLLYKIKVPYVKDVNKENIKLVIDELYDEYINNSQGFENDIKHSINISSVIGIIIIKNSIVLSHANALA